MTATTPSVASERLALGAGHMGLHWLAVGTTLVVLEGGVQLEPPARWLAGPAHTPRYPLSAGHAHVLETSGWWGLHADTRCGTHLHLAAPQGAQRPMWSWMWRSLGEWIQPRQISRG